MEACLDRAARGFAALTKKDKQEKKLKIENGRTREVLTPSTDQFQCNQLIALCSVSLCGVDWHCTACSSFLLFSELLLLFFSNLFLKRTDEVEFSIGKT